MSSTTAKSRKSTTPAELGIFELPVLPAADVFPMMSTDELAELAEDIREHGLREPLVTAMVEDQLVLVDGRNRRIACKEAGVEPAVRQLNGEDPTAYVMSANIHRRHMTKGQRAMAVAMIYPKPEKGGRPYSSEPKEPNPSKIEELFGSKPGAYLSMARTVLKFTAEAAPTVLSGALKLDDAYQAAKVLRERAELESTKLEEAATKLARRMEALRLRDEGLFDKVIEGTMTIKEAEDEASDRERQRELLFDSVVRSFNEAASQLASFANPRSADDLLSFMQDPARRRIQRQRAYKFGHTIDQKRARAGFDSIQPIFELLLATDQSDGKDEHDG